MESNAQSFLKRIDKAKKEYAMSLASSMLNEMAMSLDDFRDKVNHIQFQLVENWCLCKWCQMFDQSNYSFNHWLVEFRAYAMALQYVKVKSGSKKKTLMKELVENYDFNDPSQILKIIKGKFAYEEIANISQKKTVAVEFANKVEKLINAICSSTSINNYIANEFRIDNEQEA